MNHTEATDTEIQPRTEQQQPPDRHLYRRRELQRRLHGEMARVNRHGGPLSVIALTLDSGEPIAADAGRSLADAILADALATIVRNSRASDVLGQWEDRRFVMVATATALTDAVGFAVKLRRLLAERDGSPSPITTASFGVAEYRRGEPMEEFIERADRAMRHAHRHGGNRVATERDH